MKYEQLSPHVKRAYEIARVGNHSICIVGPLLNKSLVSEIWYAMDKLDYFQLYITDIFSADMVIEISNYSVENNKYSETIEDSEKRVSEATIRPEYKPEGVHLTLLNTALQRLEWSVEVIDKVKEVARSIAQLDKSPKVEIQHLAEAIQYQSMIPVLSGQGWIEIDPAEKYKYLNNKTLKVGKRLLLKVGDIYVKA